MRSTRILTSCWYDNSTFSDYKTAGYGKTSDVKRGSWGLYGLFDQVLMPFAQPASNRGSGVVGSVVATTGKTGDALIPGCQSRINF